MDSNKASGVLWTVTEKCPVCTAPMPAGDSTEARRPIRDFAHGGVTVEGCHLRADVHPDCVDGYVTGAPLRLFGLTTKIRGGYTESPAAEQAAADLRDWTEAGGLGMAAATDARAVLDDRDRLRRALAEELVTNALQERDSAEPRAAELETQGHALIDALSGPAAPLYLDERTVAAFHALRDTLYRR